jgi:biotin carboxyl carrier protein
MILINTRFLCAKCTTLLYHFNPLTFINMEKTYSINAGGHQFEINTDHPFNIIQTGSHEYHLLLGQMSCIGKVTQTSADTKKYTVQLYGEKIEVQISTPLDKVIEKMGYGKASGVQQKQLKAPMPGMVLEVIVQAGDTIKAGDKLVVLEAMKMENVLQASADGIIKKINVTKGEAVNKGEVLIEME